MSNFKVEYMIKCIIRDCIMFSDCTMTVHQNVCKDYIVECNKPKSSKVSICNHWQGNIFENNIIMKEDLRVKF